MFERVLIVEDHESVSNSVKQALNDLGVDNPEHVSYCDYALSWIKKAIVTPQPYDLLITDLSFEEDQTVQQITDGVALIRAVREVQPDLKILVFTAEGRLEVIRPLIEKLGINAYVRKARRDTQELKAAFEAIANGRNYFPLQMKRSERNGHSFNFSTYDITIIRLLAEGKKQKDIPQCLQDNKITPSSLSSLEKRLNQIKDEFSFTTNEQLIAYCKDFKII
ncbi:response regulator [Pedobacter psychroterrae]|uniref:Response regulator transcription factor n=1 Tax=Pedobacter psychroterrae TaxID=2530453 RepID=A0A4V2MKX5_9SPHI|nr:response regulator [Pedobacter psychroterrae]TCC99956.1 response regulator transcription factor [Pedobacter psychroterrae]